MSSHHKWFWTDEDGVARWHDHQSGREKKCGSAITDAKPLVSDTLSIHPSQAKQFTEEARAEGITGVYYDPKDGSCVFEGDDQRNKELKRRGAFDRDAGYGQWAGRNV